MARDHRSIVKSLLLKTVANGCTVEEERTARAKAREYAAAHGVDVASVEAEIARPVEPTNRRPYRSADGREDEFNSWWARAQRRWETDQRAEAEAARRRAADEASRARRSYHSIRDMAEALLKREYVRRGHGDESRGLPYEEIARLCREAFGGKTSAASIAWYASQMRGRGEPLPKRRWR